MSAIWNDQIGQTNYLVSIHFVYSAISDAIEWS